MVGQLWPLMNIKIKNPGNTFKLKKCFPFEINYHGLGIGTYRIACNFRGEKYSWFPWLLHKLSAVFFRSMSLFSFGFTTAVADKHLPSYIPEQRISGLGREEHDSVTTAKILLIQQLSILTSKEHRLGSSTDWEVCLWAWQYERTKSQSP